MNETLRRITEDGISKARADLGMREGDLQRLRGQIVQNEKLLARIADIERKRKDIATLEEEQERIIVLLERHRAELRQFEQEYEDMTRPAHGVAMPCELVLPNNQRIPLDTAKGTYVIGWYDASAGSAPDIDLHPVGGSAQGVSRQHVTLRFTGGQWTLTDLGSTNGTFLNDAPMAPNSTVALRDRTRIRLGNVLVFFRYITQTTRL
jgi:hypothetical protein